MNHSKKKTLNSQQILEKFLASLANWENTNQNRFEIPSQPGQKTNNSSCRGHRGKRVNLIFGGRNVSSAWAANVEIISEVLKKTKT